ncbi:MAG: hypothetical protein ACR2O4_08400, partial [Hyphomicrobiaceae bacterium]
LGLTAAAVGYISNGAIAQSQYDGQSQFSNRQDSGETERSDNRRWRQPDFENDGDYRNDDRRSRGEFRQRRHRAGFGGGHRRGRRFLRRFDENGDGNITRAEFANGMNERFERMDANGDGTITQNELGRRKRRRRAD